LIIISETPKEFASMSDTRITEQHDLEIEEVEADRLSHKVRRVKSQGAPARSMDELKQRAEDIADQVTYLDEGLRVVETDSHNEVVVLRSDDPHSTSDDTLEYYECQVAADGSTQLERHKYTKSTTTKEKPDFVVTD